MSVVSKSFPYGPHTVTIETGEMARQAEGAVRVSMGHALLVPYARATDWPADLKTLQQMGFRLLAMTPGSDAATLPAAMAAVRGERVAILVGAEGPGLSHAAMKASDLRVRIPMSRGTDSLNVATAAALAFYERARAEPDCPAPSQTAPWSASSSS